MFHYPRKTGTPKGNTKIPVYEPDEDSLTIDDEIEGLTYIEKYAPVMFTEEYKSRLQLLKKVKEGVLDG